MKRIICLMIVCVLAISTLPFGGRAAAYGEEVIVETFGDGSYITEKVLSVQTRAGGTVSGSKEKNYYDSNGGPYWKVVLSASFTYTGSSATCTSANCSVVCYSSDWYVISKGSGKSGNTASASATMGEMEGGVTVRRVTAYLTIQCDGNGNLS